MAESQVRRIGPIGRIGEIGMIEINNMVLFDLFADRDVRRMVTIERISRSIVGPYKPIHNCRPHPDNGGNCRFHAWPGNCDSGDGRDRTPDDGRQTTVSKLPKPWRLFFFTPRERDVFYPPLHPDRMAAVDNPDGPRPRVGVPFSQGEP